MYGGGGGAINNFDISHRGVAFVARNVAATIPESTYSYAYFVPISSFTQAPTQKPQQILLPYSTADGYASYIRISPDDSSIYFFFAPPESAKERQLYMATVGDMVATNVFAMIGDLVEQDDYNAPSGFEFVDEPDSADTSVVLTSDQCGRTILSLLKLARGEKPKVIFQQGSVSAFYPLKQGKWERLFVSSSSFIDSSLWQVVDVPEARVAKTISSATRYGQRFGLSERMIFEFWFEGADDCCVHSFMVRPSDFDENKKYPWVLMPHGGPIAAWNDTWMNRVCFLGRLK
jgi:hypothetical protein